MPPSRHSKKHAMIISDSNILSSFAAARSLPLLFDVVGKEIIHIPPAVHRELQEGLEHGLSYLSDITAAVDKGAIQVLAIAQQDREEMALLPTSFGHGEREAVALCLRLRATLLSNEKRVVNHCKRVAIPCLELKTLLKMLWREGITSKAKVKTVMYRMTQAEGLVFKRPSEILTDALDDLDPLRI